MKHYLVRYCLIVLTILFSPLSSANTFPDDPLPSWNEGPIKQQIMQFVQEVTDSQNKNYVAPENRIATIDNDGTCWVEQPFYTQDIFIMDRFKSLAAEHPEWRTQEPYQSLLAHLQKSPSPKEMAKIFALTSTGMSVASYENMVKQWLATAENPRFHKHYPELVYQPMLEVITYLQRNRFKVYIVSGGGQAFMRAFIPEVYQIPAEQIIGSTVDTQYTYQQTQPTLLREAKPLFISDNQGKPEAINLFIGKKPIIAFGNSDGDQQMLEWTESGTRPHLMLLVHHDDATREYAYDSQSKVGTFSKALWQEAKQRGWQIISMKNDWRVIFAATPA